MGDQVDRCGLWWGWRAEVLTHVALLKPALQAWCGLFWGWRDQVLTHLAPLRSALQAWWGPLRRVFGLCRACVCGSGLKGRFQGECGVAFVHGGSRVLTHVALLRPALQAWEGVWGVLLSLIHI